MSTSQLSLERLKELQTECLADDVEIDLEAMRLWSEEKARNLFVPLLSLSSFTCPLDGHARAMSMPMVPPAAPCLCTLQEASGSLEWPGKGSGDELEPRPTVLASMRTMHP